MNVRFLRQSPEFPRLHTALPKLSLVRGSTHQAAWNDANPGVGLRPAQAGNAGRVDGVGSQRGGAAQAGKGRCAAACAELAWSSFDKACRVFRYVWNGMHQGQYGGNKSLNETRIHPTQKPVVLYEWLLSRYAKPGQRVLDTHLGSGSIGVAALNMGFQLDGVELDASMFEAAARRIGAHADHAFNNPSLLLEAA